jgi:CDP-diacylglycerol--glycerol-3-phosphate 3-phosphatidyltransferase/cardiolipin synthase
MNLNIPNILSLTRIAVVPVFVIVFYLPFTWANVATAAIFAIAAFTDWLDGYLARKLDQASRFGAFLDPVADKLLVAVALILLVSADPGAWMAIPSVIIIGREIAISALREWMAEIGERAQVAVNHIGKVKTTAQMLALFMLLYKSPLGGVPVYEAGLVLLYIAAILTLWSMVIYLRTAWPALNTDNDKENNE